MEMADQQESVLPSQRIRTLRDRRGGSAVPAPAMSSSNDGRSSACSAGALVENATANRDRSDQEDRNTQSFSSDGEKEPSRKAAPLTDTDGEFMKLPRLVDMQVVKRANNKKKTGPKCKTSAGQTSRTRKKMDLSAPFSNVRPHEFSPPPAETGLTTATEDETRLTSRQVSANSADPQEEDADTDIICVNSSDASDASVRTTASGAFKRTRKRKDDDTIKKTRRTADRSSSSSERSFFGNDGKKRGRPLVTGKGAQILNIRAKNQELQSLKDEIKTMREIAEGGYDPSDFKGKRRTVMAERLEQEAIGLPVNAMAAEILQTAKKIEEVAVKSNNREAACSDTRKLLKDSSARECDFSRS
ncbi:hypothetical protein PUN28_020399 [Cardiocondyla obscurior]|uniref:Uncharacterized protein n=1 Tax=Cardiocondyla obscurior TaxID=286306 RepID=A0AAW2E468_9HYME